MKKCTLLVLFLLLPLNARADFWGGDLPLLAEIVTNTLNTLHELQNQSELMQDELRGIKDKIIRIRTISEIVQPSQWDEWKNPQEAIKRLQQIYYTLPKEYRSQKSDTIESELSNAMNLIARLRPESETTFRSGKELEQDGVNASPGLAQKLTASGTGTLVSLAAQSQVIQSHITRLLAEMLADANEKENRAVVSQGQSFSNVSESLNQQDGKFSSHIMAWGTNP